MRVKQFLVIPFSHTLLHPLVNSNQTVKTKNGFYVYIQTDIGEGVGEAAPLQGFSTESLKELSYAFEGFKLELLDIDFESFEDVANLIALHCEDLPSSQFAIETAFLDIFSKHNNQSLHKFLSSKSSNLLSCNGIFGIHSPNKGYPTIKVKIGGGNLFQELKHLDTIQNQYGNKVKLILDANESFDLTRAIRYCKEVELFNIEYIEQPLKRDAIEDLSELRYHTSIPIALDETITNFESIQKSIDMQAGDFFIIKPTLTGGFTQCKKIVQYIESSGLKWTMTSSIESEVGLRACIHFASALHAKHACGFSTMDLYTNNHSISVENGLIKIPSTIGLGLEKYDFR